MTHILAHEKEPRLRPCNTRSHVTGASVILKSIFSFLIFSSCSAVPIQLGKENILAIQSKSNSFIEINGNKYKLNIEIWNNKQRIIPNGVNVIYYLSPEDENNKDEIYVKFVDLLIFHDNQMWKPWIDENQSTINNGPIWSSGTSVTALAVVVTEKGEKVIIKSEEENIVSAY